MKKQDYTVTIMVVVGLFLLVLVLIGAVAPKQRMMQPIVTFTNKAIGIAPVAYGGRAHIFAVDQKVGSSVLILSAALKENGYIVLEKETKGKLGKIIGVSKLLSPALYSNVALAITESVAPGDQLVLKLYKDNGDGVFSDTTDTLVTGDEIMTGVMSLGFMVI